MSGGFHTKSGRSVGESLRRVAAEKLADAKRGLQRAAEILLEQAQQNLSRPGAADEHAAPGEPPLAHSRKLLESGRIEDVGEYGKRVVFGGPSAPYAALQEFGARESHPHPFLRPALEACRERMRNAFLGQARKKGA